MRKLLGFIIFLLCIVPSYAQNSVVVSGTVRDKDGGTALAEANIVLRGTGVGTVTNADGYFQLTLPEQTESRYIDISHLGYGNGVLLLPVSGQNVDIYLSRVSSELPATTVYSGDALQIVREAMKRVQSNYPSSEDMLTAFYRETIRKGRRYIDISEAMMNVSKSSYAHRSIGRDRVQMRKGRSLVSTMRRDTLSIKVAGGPVIAVNTDFVKNSDFFLSWEELDYYDFKLVGTAFFNDRSQFQIEVSPLVQQSYPLFYGTLYIDAESLAFTRAELELDMSDRDKASRCILQKKPSGLVFDPDKVTFVVAYRQDGQQTILSYVSNEMVFKCNWRKRRFSASYTVVSEAVVVDRNPGTEFTITRKDAFGSSESFSDVVEQYWDEDFWKGYNIIEPTESLERAVSRLRRRVD